MNPPVPRDRRRRPGWWLLVVVLVLAATAARAQTAASAGSDQLVLSDTRTMVGRLLSLSFRSPASGLTNLGPDEVEALVVGQTPGRDVLRRRGGVLEAGDLLSIQFQGPAGPVRFGRDSVMAISVAVVPPTAPAPLARVGAMALEVRLSYEGTDTYAPGRTAQIFAHRQEDDGDRRKWIPVGKLTEDHRRLFNRKLELEYSFQGAVTLPPGPWDIRLNFPRVKRRKIWRQVPFEPGTKVTLGYRWMRHEAFGRDSGPEDTTGSWRRVEPLPGF